MQSTESMETTVSRKSNPAVANQLKPVKRESSLADLIVFSHLRWDFVFQRPQHLMSRFAKERRVFFFEEPVPSELGFPSLHISDREHGLKVVVPHLPRGLDLKETWKELARLVDEMIEEESIMDFTAWYYTPMALPFTGHLKPSAVVYDCMDELSAFKGAPPNLLKFEAELMSMADVVFTGGQSLYEAKKEKHPNIHAFPSSIDVAHFSQARTITKEPEDQAKIKGTRLGFFGVVDERFDIELLGEMATLRPDWSFIILGPVVKIDPATLPKNGNIHYLGMKSYQELPRYLAGWDLAMLPFARNESTKFISPTKTPEYLAGGKPVVSTSIRDVVRPYGDERLVYIADNAHDFVVAADLAMKEARHDVTWKARVDAFLSRNSWDITCQKMATLESDVREARVETADTVSAEV